jgi:hypothetical protein
LERDWWQRFLGGRSIGRSGSAHRAQDDGTSDHFKVELVAGTNTERAPRGIRQSEPAIVVQASQ